MKVPRSDRLPQITPYLDAELRTGSPELRDHMQRLHVGLREWRREYEDVVNAPSALSIYNVKDYGARGDGSNNDTTAIQAAVDAADAVGGIVFFPVGDYRMSGVTINGHCRIMGAGYGSRIQIINNADNLFTVDCQEAVYFSHLLLVGGTSHTGSAIILDYTSASSIANHASVIDSVQFRTVYYGVKVNRASMYSVVNCLFWNNPTNGSNLIIDNLYNKDQGDGIIQGNTFAGGATYYGLIWSGGGGLRVINNKFLSCPVQFDLDQSTTQTAQLYVAHNSFDDCPVRFDNNSGSYTFPNILITGNYFSTTAARTQLIISGQSGTIIEGVSVVGNQFYNGGATASVTCVALYYTEGFIVSGNFFHYGTNYGVYTDANCSDGTISANEYMGCGTNIYATAADVKAEWSSTEGATSVADGGTITHLLGTTPAKVLCTPTVSGEFVSVTAVGATTFTVAIKKHDNTAGTTQTIYWRASE